ncbi:MAG TPA: transporter substrate-binding domain-containing protein [Stellaceae bacterium]|jgi:polar amino acid transport system substrate-binding protein|nr:transporter substrate-binding domain-containing protein [Stellaceae bacterium]
MPVTPSQQVISELASTGALRAAINMGNFLLVTGRDPSGDPTGVSPDMAAAIAARLGVPVKYVPYDKPGELADDAVKGLWDIGNIGAEPQRAQVVSFTAAYCEIEATYLVPSGSPIKSISEVDQAGKRVAVTARSAYCLWLENNLKNAQLVQYGSADEAIRHFTDEKMDAYAGLRPGLLPIVEKMSGARILDGQFASVQQAVGTPKKNTAAFAFLREFVEESKTNGLIASLIERHGTTGRLSVAPKV